MGTIAAKTQMSKCPTDTIKVLELNVRELLGIAFQAFTRQFWRKKDQNVCAPVLASSALFSAHVLLSICAEDAGSSGLFKTMF